MDVDNDCIELRGFKDVVQRLPERSCAFHGNHFTIAILQPSAEFQKFPGCCAKLAYFLLAALFKAGYDEFFVNINTTTVVVNPLHSEVSFHRNQIYGKASCQCYFTVRPFVRCTGQIVVQEEAKISFRIGLQAQS